MACLLLAGAPATAQDANTPAPADEPASAEPNRPADPNRAAAAARNENASDGGLPEARRSYGEASASMQQRVARSNEQLKRVREQISEERIPLTRELNRLEAELDRVRREHRDKVRKRDTRQLNVTNLKRDIDARKKEASFLSNSLLSEYIRNLETRLHIAEMQLYEDAIEQARNAAGNDTLSEYEVIEAQTRVLATSLDRLEQILGGVRFEGKAIGPEGLVQEGTYVLVGPAALFRSADGKHVGTAERRQGSTEPTIIPFEDGADANAASRLVTGEGEQFPLDPTLGNAHVIADTQDTVWEHVQKGGPVMIPIAVLAGSALLVALYKWLALSMVRAPSQRRIRDLLNAVAEGGKQAATQRARAVGGPTGQMLETGVEHMDEPRELIEEVMYEKVLATRLKLQRFLPFVAITAASAPLLGLLGTVTGIINTFKLITVFGTGDVKTLSSGISEALITTECGLIVAIPSLLMHAFLSRKARGLVDQMEKAAIALVNQVSKRSSRSADTAA
ncbi:MAG: hypothetical protein GVY24_04445 [Planctomycetes bacterium]|nr:hypothetical protein [Planctomycetota bacterium]